MALEDNAAPKVKAAAIARDVTVAFAGTHQNPNPNNADLYSANLVKVYDAIHAAALESIQ